MRDTSPFHSRQLSWLQGTLKSNNLVKVCPLMAFQIAITSHNLKYEALEQSEAVKQKDTVASSETRKWAFNLLKSLWVLAAKTFDASLSSLMARIS